MITYVSGNLFDSPAKVLVNAVNTVGVMGKGLAKDFKTMFPEMVQEYRRYCEEKKLEIGKLHLWRGPNKWVLNFPTKKHWRDPSKPEYIEAGLKEFARCYDSLSVTTIAFPQLAGALSGRRRGRCRLSVTTIAFPQLGCGQGGLDWERQVRPLMEKYLGALPIEVFITTGWTGNSHA